MSSRNVQIVEPADLGIFWTIPNILSLIRIALVLPVFYLILVDASLAWIVTLIAIGILTDWFDGRLARWSNQVSEWGKILDPLADKVGAAMIVLAFWLRGDLPGWFLVLLVSRDSLIVLGGVYLTRRIGHVAMSLLWGKVAVTAIALTILALLLGADPEVLTVLLWATASLLVYSFWEYFTRFLRMLRSHNEDGSVDPDVQDSDDAPETREAGISG